MSAPLDVIVADDAALFRSMIASVLAQHAQVREVGDAAAAFAEVARKVPDLLILDIRMPPTHTVEGLEAAVRLRSAHPGMPVLLLSQRVELRQLDRLLDGRGGVGYLLKERVAGLSEFVDAVRIVAAGGHAVDPTIVAALLERRRGVSAIAGLAPRARAVLALLAEGKSNAAIAARLHLSPKTVEAHVARIFIELRLPSDGEHNRRVLATLSYLRGSRTDEFRSPSGGAEEH